MDQSNHNGLNLEKAAAIKLLTELGPIAKEAVPALLKIVNDKGSGNNAFGGFTILRTDEEDPDPNVGNNLVQVAKAALEKIDPASFKELEQGLHKK